MVVEYLSSSSRCRLRQRGQADAPTLGQARARCEHWLTVSLPVSAPSCSKILLTLDEALALCVDRCDPADEFDLLAEFSDRTITICADVPARGGRSTPPGSIPLEHSHTVLRALCETATVHETGGRLVVSFTV
jgi:hypothetical protein